MALKQYISQNNEFYRRFYHYVIMGLMIVIFLLMVIICIVIYQVKSRPLPVFYATQPSGAKMNLQPFEEPNLLPDTIIRWANKAATLAYTFDFVNYNKQVAMARPYFTESGWQDYLVSVENVISNIVQNQLIVNSIVSGKTVISNQGPLPGKGYVWRLQIPFLVTYQSANAAPKRNFIVVVTIVRVPTEVNPQGIGIDQFVMVQVS